MVSLGVALSCRAKWFWIADDNKRIRSDRRRPASPNCKSSLSSSKKLLSFNLALLNWIMDLQGTQIMKHLVANAFLLCPRDLGLLFSLVLYGCGPCQSGNRAEGWWALSTRLEELADARQSGAVLRASWGQADEWIIMADQQQVGEVLVLSWVDYPHAPLHFLTPRAVPALALRRNESRSWWSLHPQHLPIQGFRG